MNEQNSNQTYINRDVNTGGGDFVGRDKVTHNHYLASPQPISDLVTHQLERLYWEAKENIGLKNYVELDLVNEREHTTCNDFVSRHSYVLLHGSPGSGKSTLLWHILAQAVENYLHPDGKPLPRLPFYVPFGNWDKGTSLYDFLRHQWPYEDDPFDYMASHSVWLFADGIDECETVDKRRLIELWSWFSQKNAPIQALLTCRTETYREIWKPALKEATNNSRQDVTAFPLIGYRLVHAAEIVTPLSEDQVDRFIAMYLGERADQFKQALQHHRPQWLSDEFLKVQTRNTQQLVLFLQAYREAGELPSNYGKMVESYVQSLWMRPSLMKTAGWVPFDEMCAALNAFSKGFVDHQSRGYTMDKTLLARGLYEYAHQKQSWLKYIARLSFTILKRLCLLPFALIYTVVDFLFFGRRISRSLLSLQSFTIYLGDFRLEDERSRKKAAGLLNLLIVAKILRNDGGVRFENKYVRDYVDAQERLRLKWYYFTKISRANWQVLHPALYKEVKIAAGLIDKPLQLMKILAEQDPYLASECLLSGVQVNERLRQQIVERATSMMTDVYEEDPWLSLKCAQALGKIGDPGILPSVILLFYEHDHEGHRTFNRALIDVLVTFGRRAIEPLCTHLKTCHTYQLRTVALALAYVGDQSVWKPLEDRLNTITEQRIRVWIIAVLANLGNKPFQEKIRRYLTREDPERNEEGAQCEAWMAFAETAKSYAIIEYLLDLLPGNKPALGYCFIQVVAEHFGINALQPILKRYNPSESLELKTILAEALGMIGSIDALPSLLNDLDSFKDSQQIMDDTHELWLTHVLSALGKIKAAETVDKISVYLENKSWYVCQTAVAALAHIGNSQSVEYLSRFLHNDIDQLYSSKVFNFVSKHSKDELKEDVARALIRIVGTKEAMDAATPYYIQKLESLVPESEEWRDTELHLSIIGTQRVYAAIQRIKHKKTNEESKTTGS